MPGPYGGYSLDEIAEGVSQQESSGGTNLGPRYERGFERRYLRGKPRWEALAAQYGWPAISSSYGPWQIMYPTAVELGFTGSPEELADPAINRKLFDQKFLKDFKATGDLRKTLLRYNGGGNPRYPDEVLRRLPRLPALPRPASDAQTSRLESGIRRMHRLAQAVGFGPLQVQEIAQALQQGTEAQRPPLARATRRPTGAREAMG